jgi:glycosyltransferase involved in cell wall biosynthesis
MKIFYYNKSINSKTGSSVHTNEIIKALRGNGNEVMTYPPKNDKSHKTPKSRKIPMIIKQFILLIFGIYESIIKGKRTLKIIKSYDPEMILIRFSQYDFLAKIIVAKYGNKVALEVNAPISKETNDHYLKWYGTKIQYSLENYLYNNSKLIYTVSEELKVIISKQVINTEKIFTIANGANPNDFESNPLKSVELRAKYNIDNDFVIGFVGHLKPWHGSDDLLRCMEKLTKKYERVKLIIIGGANQKEEIIDKIRSLNIESNVLHLPSIEHNDLPYYLDLFDVAVAPYPYIEDFYFSPLKLFEYMSMGKAVVASNIGQISYIINDGKNGLLFEPSNIDMMAEQIEKIYQNEELRNIIGKNARETIINNYTWNHTAEKVVNYFGSYKQ